MKSSLPMGSMKRKLMKSWGWESMGLVYEKWQLSDRKILYQDANWLPCWSKTSSSHHHTNINSSCLSYPVYGSLVTKKWVGGEVSEKRQLQNYIIYGAERLLVNTTDAQKGESQTQKESPTEAGVESQRSFGLAPPTTSVVTLPILQWASPSGGRHW